MTRSAADNFAAVLTAAVADLAEHGFDSETRLAQWMDRLRAAAIAEMLPPERMAELLRRELGSVYARLVEHGGALERHPGVPRFTIQRVKPSLRAELDRRIAASANLIKLNREESIQRTLRRFSGWATSIPAGGTDASVRAEAKIEIRKALSSLPYDERRVLIDQSHKLVSAIHSTIAEGGGAIAAKWRHVHQAGYDGRPEHEARDNRTYALRGSWAMEQGLMNKGAGYTDEIDQPAEKISCRCWWVWIYNLRDLPPAMLTAKGRAQLKQIRLVA